MFIFIVLFLSLIDSTEYSANQKRALDDDLIDGLNKRTTIFGKQTNSIKDLIVTAKSLKGKNSMEISCKLTSSAAARTEKVKWIQLRIKINKKSEWKSVFVLKKSGNLHWQAKEYKTPKTVLKSNFKKSGTIYLKLVLPGTPKSRLGQMFWCRVGTNNQNGHLRLLEGKIVIIRGIPTGNTQAPIASTSTAALAGQKKDKSLYPVLTNQKTSVSTNQKTSVSTNQETSVSTNQKTSVSTNQETSVSTNQKTNKKDGKTASILAVMVILLAISFGSTLPCLFVICFRVKKLQKSQQKYISEIQLVPQSSIQHSPGHKFVKNQSQEDQNLDPYTEDIYPTSKLSLQQQRVSQRRKHGVNKQNGRHLQKHVNEGGKTNRPLRSDEHLERRNLIQHEQRAGVTAQSRQSESLKRIKHVNQRTRSHEGLSSSCIDSSNDSSSESEESDDDETERLEENDDELQPIGVSQNTYDPVYQMNQTGGQRTQKDALHVSDRQHFVSRISVGGYNQTPTRPSSKIFSRDQEYRMVNRSHSVLPSAGGQTAMPPQNSMLAMGPVVDPPNLQVYQARPPQSTLQMASAPPPPQQVPSFLPPAQAPVAPSQMTSAPPPPQPPTLVPPSPQMTAAPTPPQPPPQISTAPLPPTPPQPPPQMSSVPPPPQMAAAPPQSPQQINIAPPPPQITTVPTPPQPPPQISTAPLPPTPPQPPPQMSSAPPPPQMAAAPPQSPQQINIAPPPPQMTTVATPPQPPPQISTAPLPPTPPQPPPQMSSPPPPPQMAAAPPQSPQQINIAPPPPQMTAAPTPPQPPPQNTSAPPPPQMTAITPPQPPPHLTSAPAPPQMTAASPQPPSQMTAEAPTPPQTIPAPPPPNITAAPTPPPQTTSAPPPPQLAAAPPPPQTPFQNPTIPPPLQTPTTPATQTQGKEMLLQSIKGRDFELSSAENRTLPVKTEPTDQFDSLFNAVAKRRPMICPESVLDVTSSNFSLDGNYDNTFMDTTIYNGPSAQPQSGPPPPPELMAPQVGPPPPPGPPMSVPPPMGPPAPPPPIPPVSAPRPPLGPPSSGPMTTAPRPPAPTVKKEPDRNALLDSIRAKRISSTSFSVVPR